MHSGILLDYELLIGYQQIQSNPIPEVIPVKVKIVNINHHPSLLKINNISFDPFSPVLIKPASIFGIEK